MDDGKNNVYYIDGKKSYNRAITNFRVINGDICVAKVEGIGNVVLYDFFLELSEIDKDRLLKDYKPYVPDENYKGSYFIACKILCDKYTVSQEIMYREISREEYENYLKTFSVGNWDGFYV